MGRLPGRTNGQCCGTNVSDAEQLHRTFGADGDADRHATPTLYTAFPNLL